MNNKGVRKMKLNIDTISAYVSNTSLIVKDSGGNDIYNSDTSFDPYGLVKLNQKVIESISTRIIKEKSYLIITIKGI